MSDINIKTIKTKEFVLLVDNITSQIKDKKISLEDFNVTKVAVYVRVSSEEQAKHGISIDAQIGKLQQHCKEKGYEIYKFYKDEGKSAKTIRKRTEFLNMMDDFDSGHFNVIIFVRYDRMFRHDIQSGLILSYLKSKDCLMYAIDESNEFLSIKISNLIATEELKKFKARVEDTQKHLVKKAKKIINRPPMGFKIEKKIINDEVKNIFMVDKENMSIVRQMFFYFSENKNLSLTAKTFKQSRQTTKNILTNRIYIGFAKYKGEEYRLDIQPQVNIDLFEKVNKIIKVD